MKQVRRLRPTVPAAPPRHNAPEGHRAAFWREQIMRLSRPALAIILGIKSTKTIAKYEGMAVVPLEYRLACASLMVGVEFDWFSAKVKVGKNEISF